ncbi:acyl-CoA dehydrogenase [Streptomyces sp. WAC 01529]|uniref:acyl-CoA dehydrogenase family protein n=1 Tax=Streptomyces sp. WAC 01529 TaxID=2203205 RepID=UPI000F6E7E63|nr:acyl-CoA dehydrogenase family protein [Streptomyces sp. WAC 01529]AZM53878.1 acyl-CoA dehydrogenase [Streptomyces sp. WAC 01529]
MDFQLTDDQRALRAGVRELLERRLSAPGSSRGSGRAGPPGSAPGAEDGLDRGLWRQLGEAGFFSLMLPEERGGVGLGLPEAVLAFEEAGRVLLPGPAVASFLAAGEVAGAAAGETVVTAVDGTLVPWLAEADVVLGDASGAVPLRSVDPLTPLHRVPGTPGAGRGVTEAGRGGPGGPGPGVLLYAAEQLGSAARTCEAAVQYARDREQFGRPIGAFQAVQHLCAQMLVRAEVARAAVYAAAVTRDPLEVAGAKLLADDAAVRNARDCLQVHGGMGFTWEAQVHLHLKRAWVRAQLGQVAEEAEEALASAL